jgi:hypothetical protein
LIRPRSPPPGAGSSVGFLVYGAITTPVTMRLVLLAWWNAPAAARKNRELLD